MENPADDTLTQSNTSTIGNTKINRARIWMFTYNNYTEEDKSKLIGFLSERSVKEYIVNPEVGKNGTPHLQGFVEFKNARMFSSLKKKFDKIHWEVAHNIEAARNYCKKDDTRVGETMIGGSKHKPPCKDPLLGKNLYKWQQDVINLCESDPDDRTIHWYWDESGNIGKTSLAKHLCLKHKNEVLFLSGSAKDCKYGVKSFLENPDNKLKIVIFGFPRTVEKFEGMYEALESVKDGIFYNTKYESGMVMYDPPHVICFANWKPQKEKLSKDRWKIMNINNEPTIKIGKQEVSDDEEYVFSE